MQGTRVFKESKKQGGVIPAEKKKIRKTATATDSKRDSELVRITLKFGDTSETWSKRLKLMDPKNHLAGQVTDMLKANNHVLPKRFRRAERYRLRDTEGKYLDPECTLYNNGIRGGEGAEALLFVELH